MKISSIALRNYQQLHDVKIDFAHDEKRNVTLIFGENGAGKSHLAEAFRWCLFFDPENQTVEDEAINCKELLSIPEKIRLQNVGSYEEVNVEVQLVLLDGEIEYTFTRQLPYHLTSSGDVRANLKSHEFSCRKHDSRNGSIDTYVMTGVNKGDRRAEEMVRRLFPEKISNFIFFNGERIDDFADALEGKRSQDIIRVAVQAILGLDVYSDAVFHLSSGTIGTRRPKQGFRNVSMLLGDEIQKVAPESEANLYRDRNSCEERILNNESRVKSIETQIVETKKAIADHDAVIKKNEIGLKKLDEIKKIDERIATLQREEESFGSELKRIFNERIYLLAMLNMAQPAMKTVADLAAGGSSLPGLTMEIIDYIEKTGRCICGEDISEG